MTLNLVVRAVLDENNPDRKHPDSDSSWIDGGKLVPQPQPGDSPTNCVVLTGTPSIRALVRGVDRWF